MERQPARQLRPLLGSRAGRGVVLGHEHKMALHAPHGGLARGRCIGCGAIPMFTADRPYAPRAGLLDPPALLPPRPGDDGTVLDHGYAMIALDPGSGSARAEYYGVGARPGLLFTEDLASPPLQAS